MPPHPPNAVTQAHAVDAMDAPRVEIVHGEAFLVGAEHDQRIRELRVVCARTLEEEPLALEPLELGRPEDDRRRNHGMRGLNLPNADKGVERLESRVDWHPQVRTVRAGSRNSRRRCERAVDEARREGDSRVWSVN